MNQPRMTYLTTLKLNQRFGTYDEFESNQNKPSEAMDLGRLASRAPNLADKAKNCKLESHESERNKIKALNRAFVCSKKESLTLNAFSCCCFIRCCIGFVLCVFTFFITITNMSFYFLTSFNYLP